MSDMQIQRIRRQSKYNEAPVCDFCDEPFETGYVFTGDTHGPRGRELCVCDGCLAKTRKSPIGFLHDATALSEAREAAKNAGTEIGREGI